MILMVIKILKQKRHGIIGAVIGGFLFTILPFFLTELIHLIKLVLGL